MLICLTSAYIKTENGKQDLDRLIKDIGENNSPVSFTRLYNLTSSAVYSFAFSILKNHHDSEDILHDCYLSIHASAQNYKSQSNPLAWILTITKNLCLMKLREKNKTADLPEDDWKNFIAAPEPVSHEDRIVIEACMNQLTEEERQIVVLHAVSEMKHREIADVLDLPLSTVLSKYHRAIKKLKKILII